MTTNTICYADWQETVKEISLGKFDTAAMDDFSVKTAQEYLRMIPVRDAILANLVQEDGIMEPTRRLLLALTRTGDTVPARTVLAAINFLESDMESVKSLVTDVLAAEEYSLARLLNNGLEMRAPASLLRHSFAHYTPDSLLAEAS